MSPSTRLSHGDYLMGWVCALPLEMAAASVMLDEVHQSLPQSPNDSNTYMLGRIGNHNLVIACLPTGIYGVISATASVVHMRCTFPQIQSALMVGIGGGAPTTDVDIRLGDVVVSKPTGTSGAVIQYDYGKTTAGGQFKRVGILDKPPILFLTAVSKLQAKYMIRQRQIAHIVSKVLEENEGMRRTFSCPGQQHDALYQSDYDHPATNKTCTQCDNRRIVTRYPRRENDSLQVHYGLIASGNQVIKHGLTRDRLAKQLGILCFEMEAAGLMDQIPCLVIRGISDYSDSHKNKDWQGYAALTAAAYAKELLSVINGRPSTGAEVPQVSYPIPTSFSPQAKHLISGAHNKLRETVEEMYPEDSVAFSDMSIGDVDNKARALERELAKSETIRNMRPIIPLLRKLREYSGAIDSLCAGTPYLSWLWAPVWMLLQVSSQDLNSMPRLLEAYKHVAEILPTSTMLSNCQRYAGAQKVLALVYVDVLDFYQQLFMVFHNRNWQPLFTTNWKASEDRRELILKNLVEVCECMTQGLGTATIIDMMERRERRLEEWRKADQSHTQSRLQSVLAWLDVKDGQEDELDRLYGLQYEGSCSWVFANNKIRRWREAGRENPVVWLTGKPGAGKSVLSACVIQTLKQDPRTEVPYYFSSYGARGPTTFNNFLKTLTVQLIRGNLSRIAYIYSECIQKGFSPSVHKLKQVLHVLLSTTSGARFVVDGVDELEREQQAEVLSYLTTLTNTNCAELGCKVLIASRDTGLIAERIGRCQAVHLKSETSAIQSAIQAFVRHELSVLRSIFGSLDTDDALEELERDLIDKADGMFLWVRLVSSSLRQAVTLTELRDIVNKLPKGLEEMYRRIVHQILESSSDSQRAIKLRVLFWMVYGRKPLKKYEILSGASIHRQNVDFGEQTRLQDAVLRQCKPLLEEGTDDTIRFVHFTAHEYFVRGPGLKIVSPGQAHFGISFACLAYLTIGLSLVDPNIPPSETKNQVARGLHSVVFYAYDNWLHHFQFCLENSDELNSGHLTILLAQAQKLYHRNCQLQPPTQTPTRSSPLANPFQHAELVKLPLIAQFLQQALNLYQTAEKKVFTSGIEADKFRLENDPTLLSEMLQAYCRIMQTLLTTTETDGVSKEQLIRFKQQFGHLAYVCRFNGCRSAFGSPRALEDHELARHTGGIRCTEASCPYSRIGFQSSKALKTHLRTYHHKDEEIPTGARVIRKKHKCGGCSQRFRQETELQRHQVSQAGTACGQSVAPSRDISTGWLESLDEGELQIDSEPTAASDENQPYELKNRSPLPPASGSNWKPTIDIKYISYVVDQNVQSQGPFSGWRAEVPVEERTYNVHSIIAEIRALNPRMELRNTAMEGMTLETETFRSSKDKDEYRIVCLERVNQIRAWAQKGSQPQQTTTAQSEPPISRTAGNALEDQLGASTMPGSMPTLMNSFQLITGLRLPDDPGLMVDGSSVRNDTLSFNLPDDHESGHPPDIFWNFEDEFNSRPADSSQPPNEAFWDSDPVIPPILTNKGLPGSLTAVDGRKGIPLNSKGMEAFKDFNSFVTAPGPEMAQMDPLSEGHLPSLRAMYTRPRRLSPPPHPALSRSDGGCDHCLRCGIRCSLLDEEQMPCSRCRQLRQNCTRTHPAPSEERPVVAIPRLNRAITDVYQDELYNPALAQQVPKQPSRHQKQNISAPSYQNPLYDRLKAANQAHLSATGGVPVMHKSLTPAP